LTTTLIQQSDQLRGQLTWFLKNIQLQLTDLKLASDGIELKFYWDTLQVRRAALGMADFYNLAGKFKKDDFGSQQTLVTCLAAAGWLLPMRLLPPHQAEFYNGLKVRFGLGREHVPPGGADQFFRDAEMGSSFSLMDFHSKSQQEQNNILKQYAGKAKLLFKAVECAKGSAPATPTSRPAWENRLADLYRNKLLDLETADEIDYNDIFQDENFIKTREFFDDARNPSKYGLNNITDATALCLIQRQIMAFKIKGEKSLPRLYEYSPLFREAMKGWESLDEGLDPLRDVHYFLFRGMFNPPADLVGDGSHAKFIESLTSIKDKVKEILAASEILTPDLINELAIDGKPLLLVINELQDYSFLDKVWLPYVAHKDISKAARDYVQRAEEVDSREFKDTVKKTLEDLSSVLERRVRQYKSMRDLYIEVEKQIERFQQKFKAARNDASEFFRIFGLLQFGVPEEYHSEIDQFVGSFLGGDQHELEVAKTDLCRKCRNAELKGEDHASRAIAICVLWVLKMNNEIRRISERGERSSWFLSLVAANAIKLKDFHTAIRNIEEVEARYKVLTDDSIKAEEAIRLAYLFFHLWLDGGGAVQWRHERPLEKSYSPEKVAGWIRAAIHFAKEAYGASHRSPAAEVYALNLYLYYVTEGADDSEFSKITSISNQLLQYERHTVWQYRFDDTLARYFHRQSTMALTLEERRNRLQKAIEHIKDAKMYSHGDPEVQGYDGILENASIELNQEANH
jgi:hypothetical protein